MLKLKLDKTTHATLPLEIQKEYKADGDGFILDTDVVFEDTTGLKSALEKERKERKEAKERVGTLESEVSSLVSEKEKLELRAKPAGDLEKSWQAKLDKEKAEFKAKEEGLTGQLRGLLVDNVATQMAAEVSTAPGLIIPHIQKRLSIEQVDGKFITRVLDGEGKASALSVNELKSEFLANKDFAPIIKASNASGGGASGGKLPPGGKAIKDMTEPEKVAAYRANPVAFDRQAAAENAVIT
jgi:hypothetical protein